MYEGTLVAIAEHWYEDYTAPPQTTGVGVEIVEILADRADCLVVYRDLDVGGFQSDTGSNPIVSVLWPTQDEYWRLVKVWSTPGDFDERVDCDLAIRSKAR